MTKAQVKAAKARAADQAEAASEAVAVAIDNLHTQVANQPIAEASEVVPAKLTMKDGGKIYADLPDVKLTIAGTKGRREYISFPKPTQDNLPAFRKYVELMVSRKAHTTHELYVVLCAEAGAPVPRRVTVSSTAAPDEAFDM